MYFQRKKGQLYRMNSTMGQVISWGNDQDLDTEIDLSMFVIYTQRKYSIYFNEDVCCIESIAQEVLPNTLH